MNEAQQMVTNRLQEVTRKTEQLMKLAGVLPDIPAKLWTVDLDHNQGYIEFVIPYDITTLRRIRRLLGDGWQLKTIWGDSDDDWKCFAYHHEDIKGPELWLAMHFSEPGSTCQRVQVGTKEEPVYKVICQ